jgi:Gpi18-like mannosyltransferase
MVGSVKHMATRIREFLADSDGRLAAAILVLFSILAIVVRLPLFGYESMDYHLALHPWYTQVQADGFSALKSPYANYAPAYVTCLALLTHLPLSDLFAIKLLSLAFDFFAAVLAYRLVKLRHASPYSPALAYAAVLCWPTVILNGSMWGQCDVIHTSWLLATLLALISKRPRWALAFFGLAFSFNFQALFLAPLLPLLWLRREVSLRAFLLIPAVFLLTGLPLLAAGKPLGDTYSVYLVQASAFSELTKNAPTAYQWIPQSMYGHFVVAGSLFALAFVFCLCSVVHRFLRHLTPDLIVQLSLTFAVAVPFLLPKMHDRFFFPADVISVVYGFFIPHRFYVPLVICLLSFLSYCPYLLGAATIDLRYVAVGMAGIAVLLLYDVVQRCRAEQAPVSERHA